MRPVLLVSIGDLTPRTAAADLLECVISVAEATSWQQFSIAWIGDGDLQVILAAQPLPQTLSQNFFGSLSDIDTAKEILSADILCVLGPDRCSSRMVSAARMTGVPVIGSVGDEAIWRLLHDGHVGWLFADYQPASIMAALAQALESLTLRPARPRPVSIRLVAEHV